MSATRDTTVGDIVAEDFRAAAVFHRFGIDYCCGGKRSVAEACRQRGVDVNDVLANVIAACAEPNRNQPQFGDWDPQALISHIVGNHHAYVRRSLPPINAFLAKLVSVHGGRHPELSQIAALFADVTAEMRSHMMKEEEILFPYILELASAPGWRTAPPVAPFGPIENPIRMMEAEHEWAGGSMARIRELTNGYTPPADGCTTYRVCLQELEAFERDLLTHVHLENNVLFPKARVLAEAIGTRYAE
jgi:regulator of cell morphogenesis and NO signaling